MALIEESNIDKIEINDNGIIFLRETTIIYKNGIEIAKNYHRMSLQPGDDVTAHPNKVIDICNAVWTPEVINSYNGIKLKNIL